MGMDPSNPHHQVMVTNSSSLEDMLMINNCSSKPQQQSEKKASSSVLARPTQPDLKCPRCDSSNTKFCYYNNYSLTQPRYFCKGCRRYWTQGGSLRNVPVGGGCRKSNKRPSPSSSATSSCTSSKKTPSQDHQIFTINSNPSSLPPLSYDSNDLTLAFSRVLHKQQQQPTSTSTTMQLGFDHHHHDQVLLGNPTAKTTINVSTLGSPDTSNENNNNNGSSFLDALRSGFLETQSGFQNFQYGFGNCNVGDHLDNQNGNGSGNGGGGIDHLPYQEITSTTTTTTRTEDYFGNSIKGERDHGAAADQSKLFMSFPWHQFSTTNGDGGNINVDSSVSASASAAGRDQLYWNNGFGSSWHGLVNSL